MIADKVRNVAGFLRDDEAELLFSLAKNKKVIVEIGSFQGKSTICLALGTKGKVYAIDPHTGSKEHGQVNTLSQFKENIFKAGMAKKIIPLVMVSRLAVNKINQPIDLLFIDGAHDYKSVKQDFDDWFPKVVNGGTVAFHDTISWPGPKRVVADKVFLSNKFKNVGVVGSITFGEKTNEFGFFDFLKNRYVYCTKVLREKLANVSLPHPLHNALKNIYYAVQ